MSAGAPPPDVATVSPDRVEHVLERLGLDGPPTTDLHGLGDLYHRWCRAVPFDNVRKLLALRTAASGPLPGMDPDDFFDSWLRHGTGGTCWPSATALDALLRACGFDSRMVAASMGDTGVATHGTTVVALDGAEWLVDTSMLTEVPVPLSPTDTTATGHDLLPTTAEPVAEGWVVTFPQASSASPIRCRTLGTGTAAADLCAARYEASREVSPFNATAVVRRNRPVAVVTVRGTTRFHRTLQGFDATEVHGPERRAALVEAGLSEEIVDRVLAVDPG